MSRKNYNPNDIDDQKVEMPVVTNVDESAYIDDPITSNEEVRIEHPILTATVIADKLNIRKNPEKIADNVITVVSKNDKLTLDDSESNSNWYKVTTASGITGFCMAKFVQIN